MKKQQNGRTMGFDEFYEEMGYLDDIWAEAQMDERGAIQFLLEPLLAKLNPNIFWNISEEEFLSLFKNPSRMRAVAKRWYAANVQELYQRVHRKR